MALVKRLLVGRPLATTEQEHQRIPKVIALAGLLVGRDLVDGVRDRGDPLRHRGRRVEPAPRARHPDPDRHRGRDSCSSIVAFSYRQTIFAYPSGGGSYVVSRENLGEGPVARRRRVAARRLHPHRRGVDLRRRRRDHLDPGVREPRGPSGARRDRADRARSRSPTCAASRSRAACSPRRPTSTSS